MSSPPRPCRCRCRCTCHRAAACAPTPCRAAATRDRGHHLPCGRLAQPCGAPGTAASVSLPVPGSRRSSPATDRAARASRPYRGPRSASALCVAGGHYKGARGRRPSREGWTPSELGRGLPESGLCLSRAVTSPTFCAGGSRTCRWALPGLRCGPHRRRALQAPTPLPRGERAKVTACVARVFSGSVSTLPPLFAFGHTRLKRGAGDGN